MELIKVWLRYTTDVVSRSIGGDTLPIQWLKNGLGYTTDAVAYRKGWDAVASRHAAECKQWSARIGMQAVECTQWNASSGMQAGNARSGMHAVYLEQQQRYES